LEYKSNNNLSLLFYLTTHCYAFLYLNVSFFRFFSLFVFTLRSWSVNFNFWIPSQTVTIHCFFSGLFSCFRVLWMPYKFCLETDCWIMQIMCYTARNYCSSCFLFVYWFAWINSIQSVSLSLNVIYIQIKVKSVHMICGNYSSCICISWFVSIWPCNDEAQILQCPMRFVYNYHNSTQREAPVFPVIMTAIANLMYLWGEIVF
jgi:hypothetical protein